MDEYKQCKNGHFYQGNECEYCPTQYHTRKNWDINNSTECPYPHDYNIPNCSHCKKSLRKEMPISWTVGSIKGNAFDRQTPWNYGWNGKCEYCGHDYNIQMEQFLTDDFNVKIWKTTRIRVKEIRIMHHIDAAIGLSGVEIETCIDNDCPERLMLQEPQKIFLSTNELKYLMRVLKDSPILQQLDSNQDFT